MLLDEYHAEEPRIFPPTLERLFGIKNTTPMQRERVDIRLTPARFDHLRAWIEDQLNAGPQPKERAMLKDLKTQLDTHASLCTRHSSTRS